MIPRSATVKPTVYRDTLFRSKSEANVAMSMDRSSIHWLYEPESYVLDGVQYTPDFYLPEINTFVEVKPEVFSSEIDRIRQIVPFIGKKLVVLSPDLRATDLCYEVYGAHFYELETICVKEPVENPLGADHPPQGGEYWTWSSWNTSDDINMEHCPVCGHLSWFSTFGSYDCHRCGAKLWKADDWQRYHSKRPDGVMSMRDARIMVTSLKNKCKKECNHNH